MSRRRMNGSQIVIKALVDQVICRLAQRDTRRFARRQMTWFRHQLAPTLSLSAQYSESLNSKIIPLISEFLLTTDR